MVYDDPHDVRNSATPHRRKQVVETYDQAIVPCLIEGAWTVCIATRYAEDDLPGVFLTRGFKTIHQRAKVEIYDPTKKPPRREQQRPTSFVCTGASRRERIASARDSMTSRKAVQVRAGSYCPPTEG